ncbi:unnamed protein product, partial [Prorocentrum cordatum]
ARQRPWPPRLARAARHGRLRARGRSHGDAAEKFDRSSERLAPPRWCRAARRSEPRSVHTGDYAIGWGCITPASERRWQRPGSSSGRATSFWRSRTRCASATAPGTRPPPEAAGGAPQLSGGLPLRAQAFECVVAGHGAALRAEAPAFAPSCIGEAAARARESALLAALEVTQVAGEKGVDEVKETVDQVLGEKALFESLFTQKGETFEEQVLGDNAFIEPLFTQEGETLEEQSMDVISNDAGVDQVLGENAFIEPLFAQKGETSEEQGLGEYAFIEPLCAQKGETVLGVIRVEVGVDQVLGESPFIEPLFAQKGETFEEQVLAPPTAAAAECGFVLLLGDL